MQVIKNYKKIIGVSEAVLDEYIFSNKISNKYITIQNYVDKEEIIKCYTDYFENYDYIIGDWSYGKLRLKGFCKENNSMYNEINDINKKDEYIKKSCAYGCKYFILEKIPS